MQPLRLLAPSAAVILSLAAPRAARSATPAPALRWTDATPDAMLDDAAARAAARGAGVGARMGALAIVAELSGRAADGHAERAFSRLAADAGVGAEVRRQAALLARMVADDEGTEAGARADAALGVVESLAILGPFRDTGGGLDAHDGPEATGFGDTRAAYSWGSYEVAWRRVPRAFATAGGVPLDVFVFPRKESCTWVATRLSVPSDEELDVSLASTGQARLIFDGADVARDDADSEALRFDRLAARVRAPAGEHLLAAKVCSGAIDDDGRVRLRVTDESGAWPAGVSASADLSALPEAAVRRAKAAFDRTPTALARALAATPAGVDGRLDVAVLRTLGGADDLRSPRAPGMLAAIADAAAGDADRLAAAAWLTPSGANRGAWLNRARAASSGDERARAFVERRLVERHVESGLADWAEAALRGAGIDAAPDAEAALIASQVDEALGTDALRLRAMRRLEAAARSDAAAPDALLEALAGLAGSYDPALAAATRDRLAARGEIGQEYAAALEARGRDAVVAAARRAVAGGVDSADDAIAVAQAVSRAGAHAEALALYGTLSRWAPNKAPVWAGLARELGAAPQSAGRGEAIAAALRRARELDPGEVRYRAELALRAHARDAAPPDDEKYLVPAQVILARRQGVGPGRSAVAAASPAPGADAKSAAAPSTSPPSAGDPPDVADRELHWVRAVVMHDDRRVSELVHYAREIVIPPRTEDDLYEDVPAEGDLTEIVRARVYRKDGGTAFPVEESDDDGRPRLRWPELAPGDVVEVAFRSWTAGPVGGRGDPPFFRLDYAGALSTHPVLYNEVDVESPRDRPIYVDVVNGKADSRDEHDEGGRHVVRLIWKHPVNVPEEPLAPPVSEIIPTVVLSTFRDWSAFRAWYAEAVRGFTEPDAQVRALAAKLTAGKTTRDEKLRALFDFVADDIRYVNYVSGEWWLPNRPQQLLARREGDCDDKAILLITLLKAVGIDAQEVMVQTRLTGQPSVVRARGAAIPLFDHGIAFLPGPNGGTYLDATSPQSRLGPLPSMDARAVALRLDGPAEIVELPSSSPEDHGVDATWTLRLRADGSADVDGEERAIGDDAFWLRTYLTEPGARAQWVEEHLVGPWFPTVDVDRKVDFRGDLPRGGAIVRWRAKSDGLARHEGPELVVPLSPSQTTASQLAPLVERTLPVWLPPYVAPRGESRTIRVVAPRGWSFEALPQGGDVNGGAFGRARLEVGRDPRDPHAVVVRRTLVFDRSRIAVDEYPAWRAWVQRVDALMHRSLRLVTGAAPAGGAR